MNAVFILGASSDIGRSLSYEYAKAGYSLVLSARKATSLENLKKDLEIRYEVQVDLASLDLEDIDKIEKSIFEYRENLIGFVLMAGYLGDQDLAQTEGAEACRIMTINYTGSCLALESAAQLLKAKEGAFIVGVSSVAGLRGRQSNYFYGSAKAGLISYLSGLRNRLYKTNVTVLTVLPGFVATKMTAHLDLPALLTAKPEQVAKTIISAQQKGKSVVYSIFLWRYIMWVIRSIPEFIFKKLSL
ncbi:SDR family oxidoreductase [bacterium]|nr:SDR family oxidoreductase [bacterium]